MSQPKKPRTRRAPTLADVGRLAGVSAMAASAVLNGARTSSRISPATRERILAAAAELRYRPNAAARALAARRMHCVGVAAVIEQGNLNHYFLEVLNGVLDAAAVHDQNTTVFTLHDWQSDMTRLSGFCDGRIDGLILVAPTFHPDHHHHLPDHTPFVALHANEPIPGVVHLETDEEQGATALVRHLLRLGHRRILHVSGPRGMVGAERRVTGYRRALIEAGLPADPTLILEAGYDQPKGYNAMKDWLARHAGAALPDALFCANDSVAIGCMEALSELGLRVPDDLSLASFDDTLLARTTVPQLTTVRQPLRDMGMRAVEALLDRLQHPEQPLPAPIVLSTQLVERASTASPPAKSRLVPGLVAKAR